MSTTDHTLDPESAHLFVVHGRLEAVYYDAAIIPTDNAFSIRPQWDDVTGKSKAEPTDWSTKKWGVIVEAGPPVLAVSVGGASPSSIENILSRLERCLEWVRDHVTAGLDRQHPIVVLPVIGIDGGGHGDYRGHVIKALVSALRKHVVTYAIDIVLVAKELSVYSAVQWARRMDDVPLPSNLEGFAVGLGSRARTGELALLLGAGVSAAAGLPSWDELLHSLDGKTEKDTLLSPTDRADLIQKDDPEHFQDLVCKQIGTATTPSLLHALLASLACREVVTTNYDLLYETAAGAAGRPPQVLPWSPVQADRPWLLKLHGDIKHPDSIVLTRRHMVTYDAKNRPSTALFESLLLTRHLLIVGTSMTDDNVLRMLHEVSEYRKVFVEGDKPTVVGTVLDTDLQKERTALWDGELAWCPLRVDANDKLNYRKLELLLDRIAFHASNDSSWLLDERFADLLDPADQERAARARELARNLGADTTWEPLRDALRELGVCDTTQR
ncbi:SIR2-like protein [Branchiibius hedensis]|uniref:SIR2-like domain-containing protein n=1 Tax=Branchiibius hedensis TaxID=672460 RepID=A0A2Y8ZSU7_9MICO|nr:SIR2 family protein [Branchiibius hedensis]PWJ26232.1 SIR2-like protein [Branchiibius hedensis]SSA35044.1 SIR2-like domain-containing protein [Branchiibius hedensis]